MLFRSHTHTHIYKRMYVCRRQQVLLKPRACKGLGGHGSIWHHKVCVCVCGLVGGACGCRYGGRRVAGGGGGDGGV